MKFASIFLIGLLIAVTHSQSFARGPGARHLGGVGGVGGGRLGFGGVGVGVGRVGFGGVGMGVGRVGFGGVGVVAPVVPVARVMPIVPVAPVVPVGGFGGIVGGPMVGRIGFGMPVAAVPVVGAVGVGAVGVRRVFGRSIPEDFKLSFLAKTSQIELSFGVQRVACDVELRQVGKLVSESVFSLTSIEPSLFDFQFVDIATKKAQPISVYSDEAITKPGFFVKSKVCFDAIFGTIKNEFKRAQFGLVVVA